MNDVEVLFNMICTTIDSEPEGRVTSSIWRSNETPPSGAIHFTCQGKEYILSIQPTDMPDRR